MRRLWPLILASLWGCPDHPDATSTANANVNVNVNANANANAKQSSDAGDPARALAAAMAAATEARGATPCERAFDGYQQMRAAVEKSARPAPPIADHDRFLATCATLPAEVQKCLELRWAVAHAKECQEAQGRLDPALQAKLQSLVGKP